MRSPGKPPSDMGDPGHGVGAAGLTDSAVEPVKPQEAGTAPEPMVDEEQRIGVTLGQGKYHIVRMLGRGGMGTVYEGIDTVLGRRVAIKFLPSRRLSKRAVIERFVREAEVAGGLQHPNIITIYDQDRDERGLYIVMEMLHPGSAGSRLKRGPYSWRVATRIIVDCCAALQVAHKAGIVHRDVKPDEGAIDGEQVLKL